MSTSLPEPKNHRSRIILAFFLALVLLALAGALWVLTRPFHHSASAAPKTTASSTATPDNNLVPTGLDIPSIGLNHAVVPIGLRAQGLLEPDAGQVGWYKTSPEPGSVGNSVIVGHVTYNGPDVFANLNKMKVGQFFTVTDKSNHRHKFVVTREKSVDKDALRNDQTVWGSSTQRNLILITCDASSKLVGEHHVNNFAVWSHLVN